MTDKVQLIRAEVKRLMQKDYTCDNSEQNTGYFSACYEILDFIDHLLEEPVSEDFEQALEAEWKGYVDRGAATVDALEDNTQELAFAKGFYKGAQWQKEQTISKAVEWLQRNIDCWFWLAEFRKMLEE